MKSSTFYPTISTLILTLGLCAQPAGAQSNADLAEALIAQRPASDLSLDLSVPASPAFVVLGVTPENIIRPANPRSLATSLLYATDQHGNLQGGFAIDSAPFLSNTTLADYRKSYVSRFLANTQISVASAQGQDEADPSTRLAFGLHMVLLNRGDMRNDDTLINDFRSIIDSVTVTPDSDPEAFDQEIAQAVQQALEKARSRAEKKPIWTLAAAPSWLSASGEAKDLEWDGYSVWTSFGFGFENSSSQVILHARYRTKERVPDPDDENQILIQDSSLVGARWRAGGKNFKYSVEAGYMTTEPEGEERSHSTVYALVLEPRVAQNLWLHLSLNGENGGDNDGDVGFRTSFKWGFDSK